jgi:hypothetical protein
MRCYETVVRIGENKAFWVWCGLRLPLRSRITPRVLRKKAESAV